MAKTTNDTKEVDDPQAEPTEVKVEVTRRCFFRGAWFKPDKVYTVDPAAARALKVSGNLKEGTAPATPAKA